jgi:hypothetical protein
MSRSPASPNSGLSTYCIGKGAMQSNSVLENLIHTAYTNTLDHDSDGTYPWHLRMFPDLVAPDRSRRVTHAKKMPPRVPSADLPKPKRLLYSI